MTQTTVIAPRYQTRFSCIGGACEDSCCGANWSISIDDDHFRKMRTALSKTKKDKAAFEAGVKRNRDAPSKQKYALIVLNPSNGRCNFMSEKQDCSLHARFGEGILPDICATYPRRQSIVRTEEGVRLETASVVSCPEAARKALLPKDAMELVDTDMTAISRDYWVQLNEGQEIYDAALDTVRAAMMSIVSAAPSLTAGLGTIAAFADALDPAFARKHPSPIDGQTLVAVVEDFCKPETAEQMHTMLPRIDTPLTVPMHALLKLLSLRLSHPEGKFVEMIQHAVKAYGISDSTVVADVAKAYADRRDGASALARARIDEMLTNYVLQFVFAYWYTRAPSLGVYLRGLFLRVALIRFLVFAHPDTQAVAGQGATDSDIVSSIERVVVEVVYKMTRDIDHHGPFVELLDKALPATMPGLEHALTLLKL